MNVRKTCNCGCRMKIEPFVVLNLVFIDDLKLINYIMEGGLDERYGEKIKNLFILYKIKIKIDLFIYFIYEIHTTYCEG